jgi:(p)ppGpp synthase/HD superfamily hydrolase
MHKFEALGIAKAISAGQKYGSEPYYTHVVNVELTGSRMFNLTWDNTMACAAYLHDVLEDTQVTANDLLGIGVPSDVVDIVELLTKDKNLRYFQNIARIIDSGNIKAMKVKLADNYSNSMANDDPSKSHLRGKYSTSIQMLSAAIINLENKNG